MRIGVSGLAVSNPTGLGRLNRIFLLALAQARPDWELHAYFRQPGDLQLIKEECNLSTASLADNLVSYFPIMQGLNRLVLEEWDLPRQFTPLKLDAYLGCDFTLPPRPIAKREAVVVPDMLPYTQPGTLSWRARWLYRRGIRRSIGRNAALLCISKRTRDELKRLFPRYQGDCRVVYPALSPKLMRYALMDYTQDHPLQVRGSLHHISDPGPFVLAVGTKGGRKNTSLLVDVYMDAVVSGGYRGSLVLVGGDGAYHTLPEKRRLALQPVGGPPDKNNQQSAEIYDLGRVSDYDLSQLYRNADLLVNLSIEEGFGYPILEALAHGTPALVTNNSSMLEIAERGIAVTPLQLEKCRERLVSALAALPLLRQEAAALPVEDYSIDRLGSELAAVLEGE